MMDGLRSIEVAVHTAPDVGTSIEKFPPNLEDP